MVQWRECLSCKLQATTNSAGDGNIDGRLVKISGEKKTYTLISLYSTAQDQTINQFSRTARQGFSHIPGINTCSYGGMTLKNHIKVTQAKAKQWLTLMKKLSRTQLGAYQKTLMLEESVQSWYMEWQQHLQLPKQLLERTENFKTKPWEWWQVPRKQHPSENWKLLQDIQLWKTDKTSRCWHRQPNSRGFIATPCLQGWASQQKGDSRDPASSTRAGFLRRETPNC